MELGKAGECDHSHGLWNGRNDPRGDWGGRVNDQRFQLGQFVHRIQPALKIGPFRFGKAQQLEVSKAFKER